MARYVRHRPRRNDRKRQEAGCPGSGCHVGVGALEGVGLPFEAVLGLNARAAGGSHRLAKASGSIERLRIAFANPPTSSASTSNPASLVTISRSSETARDDGQSHRHALDEHESERLGPRREDQDVPAGELLERLGRRRPRHTGLLGSSRTSPRPIRARVHLAAAPRA